MMLAVLGGGPGSPDPGVEEMWRGGDSLSEGSGHWSLCLWPGC